MLRTVVARIVVIAVGSILASTIGDTSEVPDDLSRPQLYLATMPGGVVGSALGIAVALLAPYNPARFQAHQSELPRAVVLSHIRYVQELMARLRHPGLVVLVHVPYVVIILSLAIATRSRSTEFSAAQFWEATLALGGLAAFAVLCSGWASQMLFTRWAFRREMKTSH